MKYLIIGFMFLASNSFAQTALSLRFGTTTLNSGDDTTYGTGFQLQGETFVTEDAGVIFALGQSNTESSASVNSDGTSKPELEVSNLFVNLGAFYYLVEPLRIAAGISTNMMDIKSSDSSGTTTSSTSLAGPFASISYMLRVSNLALGLEYNYSQFGEFSQSNLIFILGLAF